MKKDDIAGKMGVDITKTTPIICECGNYTFIPVMFLRQVSAIISPTGKEEIAPIPAFACNSCGKVPDRFVGNFMRDEVAQSQTHSEESQVSKPVATTIPHLTLEK